ncbi:hypothetical protein [Thalassiella azotivora]
MSTERLGDGTTLSGSSAMGTPPASAVPSRPVVLDLDGPPTGPPGDAGSARALRALPRWALRTVPALLAGAAVLLATAPEPRSVPGQADLVASVSAGGPVHLVGDVTLRVTVRNTGRQPVTVDRLRLAVPGAPERLAPVGPTLLGAQEAVTVLATVRPDCAVLRGSPGVPHVALTARGGGGSSDLRLVPRAGEDPLDPVCPRRGNGLHVVLTDHEPLPDGSGVVLRLVNAGSVSAVVDEPGSPPRDQLVTRPSLPRLLEAGQARLLTVRWKAACPPGRAVTVPRLEARAPFGWQPVRTPAGAVAGSGSAVDERC